MSFFWHFFFFVQVMEGGELPWLLVNEIGGVRGILHSHVPFLKKHFHLITMKEFLENRKDVGKKVQAIYLWWHKPVIDKELLQSLPNLKVIANSGVGMDHLDLNLVASFGVKMANAPRAVSSSTADTGMALLLASARRLVEGNISILLWLLKIIPDLPAINLTFLRGTYSAHRCKWKYAGLANRIIGIFKYFM